MVTAVRVAWLGPLSCRPVTMQTPASVHGASCAPGLRGCGLTNLTAAPLGGTCRFLCYV